LGFNYGNIAHLSTRSLKAIFLAVELDFVQAIFKLAVNCYVEFRSGENMTLQTPDAVHKAPKTVSKAPEAVAKAQEAVGKIPRLVSKAPV